MEVKHKIPDQGYVVIRCDDGAIVARFSSFPAGDRAVMYRRGDMVSFMPLQPDEIVGNLSLFAQMLEKARSGSDYPVLPGSVKLSS